MSAKIERTKNFTEAEKTILVQLIQEHRSVLENKTTNGVSLKEKEDCWLQLQIKFMSRSKGTERSVKCLKTCWENVKKRTKKQFAKEKQAIYKTGTLCFVAYFLVIRSFEWFYKLCNNSFIVE